MKDNIKIIVAHPGVQHSYQAALAMQEAGLLHEYVTGFYYKELGLFAWFLRHFPAVITPRLKLQLRHRHMDGLASDRVVRFILGDLMFTAYSKVKPLEGLAKRFSFFQKSQD